VQPIHKRQLANKVASLYAGARGAKHVRIRQQADPRGAPIASTSVPPGWSASEPRASATATTVEVTAPDHRVGTFALEVRQRLDPKGVRPLAESLVGSREAAKPLVVSPCLSEGTRARLRDGDVGYFDLTGDARIVMQTTEVTHVQWQARMGNNPSHFTGDTNRPVERVSWYDAVACADAMSLADGLHRA